MANEPTAPGRYKIDNGKVLVRCGLCGDWHHYSTTNSLQIKTGFGVGWVDARRKSTYHTRCNSVSRIGNPAVQRTMFPKFTKFPEVCPRCFAQYDANGNLRSEPEPVRAKPSTFDGTPRLVKKGAGK